MQKKNYILVKKEHASENIRSTHNRVPGNLVLVLKLYIKCKLLFRSNLQEVHELFISFHFCSALLSQGQGVGLQHFTMTPIKAIKHHLEIHIESIFQDSGIAPRHKTENRDIQMKRRVYTGEGCLWMFLVPIEYCGAI